MVIAIEGLPGAGKTSTALLLAERLEVAAVCETTHAHPFLDSVYRDDERHDLEVELAFLLLHSSAWRAIDRSVVTVTDFAPAKDVLFAEAMLADPSDKALFDHAYQRLYEGFQTPDVVIYLRARPALCIERVRKRYEADDDREFEKSMSVDRLTRMEHFYEHALATLGDEVLVLDLDEVLEPTDSESTSKDRVVGAVLELLQRHTHLPISSTH